MPYYDHDKDYPFAAFITNLGKYNEGELVGEWVKFPTTAEELKEVFKRIGIGQKDDFGQPYEEWFITDYDCYVFRRDELERFRPSPNPQANAGKYPHSHPCPLRFSG